MAVDAVEGIAQVAGWRVGGSDGARPALNLMVLQRLIADQTVPPSSQERPDYGATSDQNTCTSKWPLDGSGSP